MAGVWQLAEARISNIKYCFILVLVSGFWPRILLSVFLVVIWLGTIVQGLYLASNEHWFVNLINWGGYGWCGDRLCPLILEPGYAHRLSCACLAREKFCYRLLHRDRLGYGDGLVQTLTLLIYTNFLPLSYNTLGLDKKILYLHFALRMVSYGWVCLNLNTWIYLVQIQLRYKL